MLHMKKLMYTYQGRRTIQTGEASASPVLKGGLVVIGVFTFFLF